jgi:anti-sigma-K factor RskA
MSEHLDLFGLLRGELGNAEAVAAGDHLDGCATCRDELAETVVGHALLTRAGATLGAPAAEPALPAPPLLAPSSATPARRRGPVLLAAAAAVALVATVGAVAWWHADEGGTSPGPGAGIEAALSPLSVSGAGDGQVRMVEHDGRTRMQLSVHDLPRTTSGEFYYAWLLDPSTNKMLPLGQVDPATGSSFDLDDALVSSYSAVDVSLEADDGDPAHSVTSVLRGTYQPDQITTAEGKQQ